MNQLGANQYLNYVIDYCQKHTPIHIKIDAKRYDEILSHLAMKDITNERKELISAVYTLIYSAIHLNQLAKDPTLPYLSYNVLVADYIYSYCSEILYSHREGKLLKAFAGIAKRVLIDTLYGNDTSYFLEEMLENVD